MAVKGGEKMVRDDEEIKETEVIKTKKQKEEKVIANTDFKDKYTNINYTKGTEFIITNVKETEKINDKQYKITKIRAEELKSSGYVD